MSSETRANDGALVLRWERKSGVKASPSKIQRAMGWGYIRARIAIEAADAARDMYADMMGELPGMENDCAP